MKKIYLTLLWVVGLFVFNFASAQTLRVEKDFKQIRRANATTAKPNSTNTNNPVQPQKCGYNFVMEKARANGFKDAEFEAQINRIIEKKLSEGGRFTGPVTIPVIFHVIYRTANTLGPTSPNLSASKFASQIAQLNNDYRNLSGSTYGVAADVQIQFCLALVDTAGKTLAEPGIERINGQTRVPAFSNTNTMSINALQTYFEGTIKPQTIWDPYSYFNIWTAAMDNSGLLGYATFPGLSTLPGLDAGETTSNAGVVLNWSSVGSVTDPGTDPDYGYGRTLTHEAGHFFGLRHIWGDATCGNDFCGDTPPQDDATSGCPTPGTLNNCTPSQPKMFENYMDYSNDACLNTFTANQATRCQTVMDNSPRRLTLITSRACNARAANAIGFTKRVMDVTETGLAGSCPNVRTYTISLGISGQSTGAATINFTSSGTATLNKDYSISPSSVSYTANDNSLKTITLTIIDDKASESTETINISYTISGTGVVAGPDKQTLTVNILDDDINPIINNNAVTLLNENFESGAIPATWVNQVYGDGVSTPNAWVVSANGGMSGTYSAHITDNVTSKPLSYNVDNASDAYLITPLIDATGLSNINISFNYKANGEVDYDEGYIGYIPEGMTPSAENTLFFNTVFNSQTASTSISLNFPASFNNTKFYFVFNWYNDNSLGTNPPFTIDNIVVTGAGMNIANSTDADTAFVHYSGQTVSYFSNSGTTSRIIARVANPNQDLNCMTAIVTGSGNGQVALTTNTGSYLRSAKVIRLTPAVANTTATYQATFYFTTAELAIWGANVPNLKIMKVTDGTSLSSTLNASNSRIFTPVVNDQRATAGYASFTINATGGFSQFFLASQNVALPVSLLSFEARPNGRNILLNWSTSMESNNKGFVVERSTNGTSFERIGWVDGAINSSARTNYSYTDNFVQPNQLYYYRLRQTDMDARETLSETRSARINGSSDVQITLSPNPAKGQLKVFTSGTNALSDINLYDAKGQLIKSWRKVNCTTAPYQLDISNIAAGMYMMQVVSGDTTATEKIIIHP